MYIFINFNTTAFNLIFVTIVNKIILEHLDSISSIHLKINGILGIAYFKEVFVLKIILLREAAQ